MTHAEAKFFELGSVTRKVHASPFVVAAAGTRALILQALHPTVIAAVAEHGGFDRDPWGRLLRTARYVNATTWGTVAEAEAAGAAITGVHRRVNGTEPVSGSAYQATDPALLA